MARPKCSLYKIFVGRQEAREEVNETFTVPAVDEIILSALSYQAQS